MILKASQRAGGRQLAAHLLRADENEHVEVHELRGFVADDLDGAFTEAYAASKGKRRRQATANRLLSVLKASLNHAWRNGKAATDAEWRKVQPFEDVDLPRLRFLSTDECLRLLNAAPPDFRQLAMGALYTGLRLGELLSLRAGDVAASSLRVTMSKSGKPRSVPLSTEGAALFAELAAGKQREELIYQRYGAPWNKMAVSRYMRAASKAARLDPPATFHDLRRSYASLLINAGADAATIQKLLGHSDTRMPDERACVVTARRCHHPNACRLGVGWASRQRKDDSTGRQTRHRKDYAGPRTGCRCFMWRSMA